MKKLALAVPFLLVASLVFVSVSYSTEKHPPKYPSVPELDYEDVIFPSTIPNGYFGRILRYYNLFSWHGKIHGVKGSNGGVGGPCTWCP